MRSGSWTVTVRHGPAVERLRRDTLAGALHAMEARIDELAPLAPRAAIALPGRRVEPVRVVALRAEVAGPGGLLRRPCGGVDVRGDGSVEAYTGKLRRSLVECAPGQSAYDALRVALSARGQGVARRA
jgi:hypothetical protein